MRYQLQWEEEALSDLMSLPKKISILVTKKIESYLVQNPRQLGKPLTGELSGLYSYRVGDYRVMYSIVEKEVRISVIRIGHRKDVYEI